MKSSFETFPQKDGRMWVVETHVDDLGVVHTIQSLQDGKAKPEEWLATNAQQIQDSLKSSEAFRNSQLKLNAKNEEMKFDYSVEDDADLLIKGMVLEVTKAKQEIEAKAAIVAEIAGVQIAPDAVLKNG